MITIDRTALAVLVVLTGCYTSYSDPAAKQSASASSETARSQDAGSAGSSGATGRSAGSTEGHATGQVPGSSPAKGSGGCPAILGPDFSITADTSAFRGLGGDGFDLVGVCDRCGWKHDSDSCSSLVYTVPTIENLGVYQACSGPSFKFVDCVEHTPCVCDGEVPEPCRMYQSDIDTCVMGSGSSPR